MPSSPVSGIAGAARVQRLNMKGLRRAEKHGKRSDASGLRRRVNSEKPLVWPDPDGLDLEALYERHIDGAFVPKGDTVMLHNLVQFPTELIGADEPDRMLEAGRLFCEKVYGPTSVVAARIDLDEKGRHVVDVFVVPVYQKKTKHTTKKAVSISRHLKELAKSLGLVNDYNRRQDEKRNERKTEDDKRGYSDPKAKTIGDNITEPNLYMQGVALQTAFYEFMRDEMGLVGVKRGHQKRAPGFDWLTPEMEQLRRQREDVAQAKAVQQLVEIGIKKWVRGELRVKVEDGQAVSITGAGSEIMNASKAEFVAVLDALTPFGVAAESARALRRQAEADKALARLALAAAQDDREKGAQARAAVDADRKAAAAEKAGAQEIRRQAEADKASAQSALIAAQNDRDQAATARAAADVDRKAAAAEKMEADGARATAHEFAEDAAIDRARAARELAAVQDERQLLRTVLAGVHELVKAAEPALQWLRQRYDALTAKTPPAMMKPYQEALSVADKLSRLGREVPASSTAESKEALTAGQMAAMRKALGNGRQ